MQVSTIALIVCLWLSAGSAAAQFHAPVISARQPPKPNTENAPEPNTEIAPEPNTEIAPEPNTEIAPEPSVIPWGDQRCGSRIFRQRNIRAAYNFGCSYWIERETVAGSRYPKIMGGLSVHSEVPDILVQFPILKSGKIYSGTGKPGIYRVLFSENCRYVGLAYYTNGFTMCDQLPASDAGASTSGTIAGASTSGANPGASTSGANAGASTPGTAEPPRRRPGRPPGRRPGRPPGRRPGRPVGSRSESRSTLTG